MKAKVVLFTKQNRLSLSSDGSHVAMVGIAMAVGRQKCFLDLIQEDRFLSTAFFVKELPITMCERLLK